MCVTVQYPSSADLSALLASAVDRYVNTWSWLDWTQAEIDRLSEPSDLDTFFNLTGAE